jgi:trimethylamine--corrinoid protein Co-methyltransferase
MLSETDCRKIHQASCQILETTGLRIYEPESLGLLEQAGAKIVADRAFIPSELVDRALDTVPTSFNLYSRGSDQPAICLDGKSVYFGPGSDTLRYLDPRSGERRPFRLADLADCARVCDALPQIDFVMSMGVPQDAPEDRSYFPHQFAAVIANTTKPIVMVCDTLEDLQAMTAIAAASAGGWEGLQRYPSVLLYSEPTTPLQHPTEATRKLLFCAEQRIPITHSPAPMMGGTAPVTAAGAVALGNAEVLSSLVMHQLKGPGAPFLYGHGVHHLDMKTMVSVYGAPEFQLARIMAAEMGRYYSLPVWGYGGHSDSKVVDAQAAVDAQFSVMVALLAGTNLNHDVGYLESGLAHSPEYMLLTNEIIAMNRRFAQGVRLDPEALALEVIDTVGPGGEFLSTDHTMANWRDLWLPEIFDRQRLESWVESGGRSTAETLRERTLALMDSHKPAPLPVDVQDQIALILEQGPAILPPTHQE